MSFLPTNDPEFISARITNKGRQRIAEGNFNIRYFQIGDSEFDYKFHELDGGVKSPQKVFAPLDNDLIIKYPYKLYSETSSIGATYGVPIPWSQIASIKNNIGYAGFVGGVSEDGAMVICETEPINITQINGTNQLSVFDGSLYEALEFITIMFSGVTDPGNVITNNVNSLIFKITNKVDNTLTLDRNLPNLESFIGTVTIIHNDCDQNSNLECIPSELDPLLQQDPWTLNIVWGEKPAGLNEQTEDLVDYKSNVFVSTKEFLGYNTSKGQIFNTGTTITNSYGDKIIVQPEDQHSIAIIHYDEPNSEFEPEKFFKYEDYISHVEKDLEYFELYIPLILYHRNISNTVGARFFMDSNDHFIDSNADDTRIHKIKFRYLIDEQGTKVGKIFTGKKIIVIDDQELVGTLDYKSNRKYTLPVPRVKQIPFDVNYNLSDTPLMYGGVDGNNETYFLTYLFETSDINMNGLHCNYYSKITGTTLESDISIKFNEGSFKYMKTNSSGYINGFFATKFKILIQRVDSNEKPEPHAWKVIDFTDKISGHTIGNIINPTLIENVSFVVSHDLYENALIYNLEDQLGILPILDSNVSQFGDTQPFPGSLKLRRATDIQVLRFFINLPSGEFETTQNPTYVTGQNKVITDVALLDENKEVLVIGKLSNPLKRIGTQTISLKLDF